MHLMRKFRNFKDQLEKKERRMEHISDEIKEYNVAEIRRYEERREELNRSDREK